MELTICVSMKDVKTASNISIDNYFGVNKKCSEMNFDRKPCFKSIYSNDLCVYMYSVNVSQLGIINLYRDIQKPRT